MATKNGAVLAALIAGVYLFLSCSVKVVVHCIETTHSLHICFLSGRYRFLSYMHFAKVVVVHLQRYEGGCPPA